MQDLIAPLVVFRIPFSSRTKVTRRRSSSFFLTFFSCSLSNKHKWSLLPVIGRSPLGVEGRSKSLCTQPNDNSRSHSTADSIFSSVSSISIPLFGLNMSYFLLFPWATTIFAISLITIIGWCLTDSNTST